MVKKLRPKARRVPATKQRGFGFESAAAIPAETPVDTVDAHFVDDDPSRIFVGEQRLDAYLTSIGMDYVLKLRLLLRKTDVTAFVDKYALSGRRALHPRVLLGLIVYGAMNRVTSLRDLESLARRDVGAWWICGGAQPDHSTIGRFFRDHKETITDTYFVSLTTTLIKQLGLKPGVVAGDGTGIQAAVSSFNVLKAEAARKIATDERAKAADNVDDVAQQQLATQAENHADIAEERERKSRSDHGTPGGPKIAPLEPDAVIQRLKGGSVCASYKPGVVVHESGLIVGNDVHASNESVIVEAMMKQHDAIMGGPAKAWLLDAGYFNFTIFKLFAKVDVPLMCPSGKARNEFTFEKREATKIFPRSLFIFQEENDSYRCPAGKDLTPYRERYDGTRNLIEYATTECSSCELRPQCTTAQRGRKISRYEDQPLKDAMIEHMKEPRSRRLFRRRSGQVEPVFGHLKENHGLKRFRRRGLANVRMEFAIQCIAFNLKRAASRLRLVVAVCAARCGPNDPWRPIAIVIAASF